RTIAEVHTHREGLRAPFPARLRERLAGRKIIYCRRRAKYIVVELEDGQNLVIHLGMSGQIFLMAPGHIYKPRKHDQLVMGFDDGSQLAFNDARRFGVVLLLDSNELETHPSFRDLGPEPLERSFNGKKLMQLLRGKKTDMKAALMDQRVVAGLGNIYVSEA